MTATNWLNTGTRAMQVVPDHIETLLCWRCDEQVKPVHKMNAILCSKCRLMLFSR